MTTKKTIQFVTGNTNKLKEVVSYVKSNDHLEIVNISLDCKLTLFVFLVSNILNVLCVVSTLYTKVRRDNFQPFIAVGQLDFQ